MIKQFVHIKEFLGATIFRFITFCFPKDNALWVFGSWKGTNYTDNSKYMFEYISMNHKEINAVWVTKNRAVYSKLKEKNYNVVFYPTIEAIYLISKSKILFQTEGYKDVGNYPVSRAVVIQLWHGIPAKMANWYKKNNFIKNFVINVINGNRKDFLWISPSNYYMQQTINAYGIPREKFIDCGYPRNDNIHFQNENNYISKLKKSYRHVVLYLPTHRNWGADFNFDFIRDGLWYLDKFLIDSNVCFLYKAHPNEIELVRAINHNFKNVILLDGKEYDDVYQYLYYCDCLVSDYSSVIYDFLPTRKPIVLFPYDIMHYMKYDGGIPKEYFSHQVGPICDTWQEMITTVLQLLASDTWKDKRAREIEFFNPLAGKNNCERLYRYIINNVLK